MTILAEDIDAQLSASYQAIYEQLSGQPRQDFFHMPHMYTAEKEAELRQSFVHLDWDEAILIDQTMATPEETIQDSDPDVESNLTFLDSAENRALFDELWSGDASNASKVYQMFESMARAIGAKYANMSKDRNIQEDIRQAAFLGIGEAISSIQEHRTTQDNLNSIVHFRVIGEVINVFRHNNMFGSSAFGVRSHELSLATRALSGELHREPSIQELAETLDWTKEDVVAIRVASIALEQTETSQLLEQPSTEDRVFGKLVDRERFDAAMQSPSAEEEVLENLTREIRKVRIEQSAKDALARIKPFDRDIFERYYGLGGYEEPQRAKAIGEAVGESHDNVRQILSRTRRRLQKELVSPYDPDEAVPIIDGRF